jgi:lipid II:glycine glycyltransferase (peptidoglycan interpeptide bridge formation enzyme)
VWYDTKLMAKIVIPSAAQARVQTDAAWDCFVAEHAQAQFLQTSAWAALKQEFGWQAQRVVVGDLRAPRAGASILLRQVLGLAVAYVPRGPVVDWADAQTVEEVVAAATAAARQAGASILRIEPELADSFEARALLRGYGFVPSLQTVQPPSTIVLDLRGDEAAILARMKSKWRYNIRLAERKGVTVRAMGCADLPQFARLMAETGARDGFALHSAEYYAAAFARLTPQWGAYLVAEYEGVPLGALVVVVCGRKAWYLWGASGAQERSRMPNHALQWAAMRWAKTHGAEVYDLWGIPDAIGQIALGLNGGRGDGVPTDALPLDLEMLPSHDLWGVYRFKQGFGGEVVRHVGTWDLPLEPLRYRLFVGGLRAQRAWRALRTPRRAALPERGRWQAVTDAAAWRATTAALPVAHVLQSWEWGAVKAQTGWEALRLVQQADDGKAVAAFQWLDRRLASWLPLRVGYVPKGPLLDWDDPTLVAATLAQIETLARARRCIFVKIDPDVREEIAAGVRLRQALRMRGWRFSQEQIQFKNSAVTDLHAPEDELLEGMKSKWRYNVRLAERRGITVRTGTMADLDAFYALYQETGARDGFLIRPLRYYRTTWQTYLAAEADAANPAGGVLLLAEHADEAAPVAGVFLLRYGDHAWYFYGASSERRRRDMPNYLLQWEAMRWARVHGCTVYDWWGAPAHIEDPDDRLQGVWQFKQGFGAVFEPHVGAWDYPVMGLLYRLYVEGMPRVLALLRRGRGLGAGASTAGE